MIVWHVFYQATVRSIVAKSESGYSKVQSDLVLMRWRGDLPDDWIVDNTRWQRKPRTFNGVQEALYDTARLYREALWSGVRAYVEVWLERDALAGGVYLVTSLYDVSLMVARGYASLSFLHSAAEYINALYEPVNIYHFGDFDPSGVNAGEKIEETLNKLAPDADITFERVKWPRMRLVSWKALVKGTLRGFATVEPLPIELKLLPRWGWRRVC